MCSRRSVSRAFPYVLALVATLLLTASPPPARAFDAEKCAATINTIASDDFGGRYSGLESGRKIEEYVAAHFKEWGLAPAGQSGTYFKEFSLLLTKERGASVALENGPLGTVNFVLGDDFECVTNAGSGDVTAEAILVGHGCVDPHRKWDDYGPTDVKGKIAIIVRGSPENGYDWGLAASRDSTLHEAVKRGAKGVIFVGDGLPVQGAAVHDGSYFPEVPSVFAGDHVLQELLMNTGYDMKRYKDELKEKPVPMDTGKKIHLRTSVSRVDDGRARDCVGMLEGSDPVLKNEIVVMGGHMDHVGTNGNGLVYNGANDNGSGCALVMELARSFAQSGTRPKRTLVFMTFAGEEQGLLGSEAFVKEPTIDLKRVVTMINFDMVGHGNGKAGIGGTEMFPEIRKVFAASMDSARADSVVIGRAWRNEASDHAPFWRAGVPIMNGWSEGDHRFYHTFQDDPKWIKPEVLSSVGRMAESWIRTLADWPTPLMAPHLAGRAMLYGGDQINFDAAVTDSSPTWVHSGVRWFDVPDFGSEAYVGALAEMRDRVEAKHLALVRNLKDLHEQTKDGRRGTLIGLRMGSVAKERAALLTDLEVGFLRCDAGAAPDSATLARAAKAGVIFLVPADSARLALLPKDSKRCIRIFPGGREHFAPPDSLSRKQTLFVVSYEGGLTAAELSAAIDAIGWDRVHLDLVPWLAKADEPTIYAFLEELQAAGKRTAGQMTALLGGNLSRL